MAFSYKKSLIHFIFLQIKLRSTQAHFFEMDLFYNRCCLHERCRVKEPRRKCLGEFVLGLWIDWIKNIIEMTFHKIEHWLLVLDLFRFSNLLTVIKLLASLPPIQGYTCSITFRGQNLFILRVLLNGNVKRLIHTWKTVIKIALTEYSGSKKISRKLIRICRDKENNFNVAIEIV